MLGLVWRTGDFETRCLTERLNELSLLKLNPASRTIRLHDTDITQWFVAPFVVEVDRGAPKVFVAGVHAGCFELFWSRPGPRNP